MAIGRGASGMILGVLSSGAEQRRLATKGAERKKTRKPESVGNSRATWQANSKDRKLRST